MLREARTPESSAVLDMVLGNLALQSDRMDVAEGHFRDAVTRFPSFRRAWRNLGLIQAHDQHYDDAISSFTKMIELGGGDAISLGLLGDAYLAKQDYLAAESAFRQALLLEPDNASWRVLLARSVVKQEKYEEAAALLGVHQAPKPGEAVPGDEPGGHQLAERLLHLDPEPSHAGGDVVRERGPSEREIGQHVVGRTRRRRADGRWRF